MEKEKKEFDLEGRLLKFGKDTRIFIKKLPRTISNVEDCRQLARSSGSMGANYIEGNEALGKKDFVMRMRIARKESKESRHWLNLADCNNDADLEKERDHLIQEATEFIKIFSAIINKIVD